jgi:hypothetical protein
MKTQAWIRMATLIIVGCLVSSGVRAEGPAVGPILSQGANPAPILVQPSGPVWPLLRTVPTATGPVTPQLIDEFGWNSVAAATSVPVSTSAVTTVAAKDTTVPTGQFLRRSTNTVLTSRPVLSGTAVTPALPIRYLATNPVAAPGYPAPVSPSSGPATSVGYPVVSPISVPVSVPTRRAGPMEATAYRLRTFFSTGRLRSLWAPAPTIVESKSVPAASRRPTLTPVPIGPTMVWKHAH